MVCFGLNSMIESMKTASANINRANLYLVLSALFIELDYVRTLSG